LRSDLQTWENLSGKLHDDGRGDVGHYVEREYAQPLQCTAREHIEHLDDTKLLIHQ
jgi:hypothetical protein